MTAFDTFRKMFGDCSIPWAVGAAAWSSVVCSEDPCTGEFHQEKVFHGFISVVSQM